MRFSLLTAVLFTVFVLTVMIGARPLTAPSVLGIEQEVKQADREFTQAMLDGDLSKLGHLLAPEFTHTNTGGKFMSRSEFLRELTRFESLNTNDVSVNAYGEVAVVTGRMLAVWREGGDNIRRLRYIRVYVKKQGEWQAVASQYTITPE